jgi:hypothetical protein
MSAATKDFLALLHQELALQLTEKIKSGSATAADMAVARQFLKDNGIEAAPAPGSPLEKLQNASRTLPEFGEEPDDAFLQ